MTKKDNSENSKSIDKSNVKKTTRSAKEVFDYWDSTDVETAKPLAIEVPKPSKGGSVDNNITDKDERNG